MKNLKLALLGLTGLISAVPGLAVLSVGLGAPPGLRTLFAVGLEVAGASMLGVILINRKRIQQLALGRATRIAVISGAAGLVLLLVYFLAFDAAVFSYRWTGADQRRVVVPFGVEGWAGPRLRRLVYCAAGECGPPPPDPSFGSHEVITALERYGPGEILPLVAKDGVAARRLTIATLFLNYVLLIWTLVIAFGISGLRLAESEVEPNDDS